ncbi:HAD family hydrolase [Paraferrimonas sedimenticola]|uniref:Phosphoglycolate phosphatase, bacterial n=1 Tax=Paraferrimonas sedimenticola TaxID=375674 RepID=A0AA37VXL1_9GAMM|nr:HAD-IIIA family hydrolase [Paraferrimonas sedimenticola]GLP96624.1 phosphoglycolate phosphatase, bacterial [Paraferrimonas sedimenticola]
MAGAVLFDLDGTIIDTAPDLVAALNDTLVAHGYQPAPFDKVSSFTSDGSTGLLRAALGELPDERVIELKASLLEHYVARNGERACLYPEMPELLSELQTRGFKLGVITNKPARFTRPLLEALDLIDTFGTVISGDSCIKAKPSPFPMRLASQQLGVDSSRSWYLGDARRDMEAAHAVGMQAVAVSWGYIKAEDPIASWPKDRLIESPLDLLGHLD